MPCSPQASTGSMAGILHAQARLRGYSLSQAPASVQPLRVHEPLRLWQSSRARTGGQAGLHGYALSGAPARDDPRARVGFKSSSCGNGLGRAPEARLASMAMKPDERPMRRTRPTPFSADDAST